MKRILSVVLLLALVLGVLPQLPVTVEAHARYSVINTSNVTGQDIADCARSYLGALRYNGSDYKTRTGFGSVVMFDCSGFVYRVLRDMNLGSTQPNASIGQKDPDGNYFEGKNSAGYYYITAHTQQQRYYGTQLTEAVNLYKSTGDYSLFQPGDLMVFSYNGGASVSHMAIYVGNGRVVHSTSSKGVYETALSQTGWPNGKLGNSLIDANRVVTSEHSYNNLGICTHCNIVFDYNAKLTTVCAGDYSVLYNLYLRKTPYYDDTKVSELIYANTEVKVLAEVTNALGESWFKVDYNGVVGYTKSENLKLLNYAEQSITCVLNTPQEGEVIPQAVYNLTGTITSTYPLAVVEAYIDGSLYTTVQTGQVTTLDIRTSDINKKLSFSSLASGSHTLTLKARDIHRSELETICTRVFTVDGEATCTHSYTGAVTTEPTCTQNGVMTYTCTWCKDTYTEIITGAHSYNNLGICSGCNEAFDYNASFSTANAGIYAIAASLYLRATPYYDDAKVSGLLSKNTEVLVLGEVTNAAGETWAKINVNDVIGYHRMENLTFLRDAEQACTHNYKSEFTDIPTCTKDGTLTYTCTLCGDSYAEVVTAGHDYEDGVCNSCGDVEMDISCEITSPAEGATIPQASQNVLGQIESRNPLALVEAYIDGTCYASIPLGDTNTLEIRTSDINLKLSFKTLPAGEHTLVIKACDIYHNEMVTVCTRQFVTAGTVSCDHNYTASVTKEPTCTQTGVMTHTCTLCNHSYTVTIAARHDYTGGICSGCGILVTNKVVLSDDMNVDLSLTHDLYIDLAGYDMTGTIRTNGYQIFGMDSATDSYTNDRMGYFTCTDANGEAIRPRPVTTTADMVRYMAINTDEGYTFHRFYLGITHLNLVPGNTGFGYKAQFRGDEMVQGYVQSIGYSLWLEYGEPATRSKNGFVDKLTLCLKNVDVDHYGEDLVYARVSMTLDDGTVVESAVHFASFRQLVEGVAQQSDSFTDAQLTAVRNMIEKYPVMQNWQINNLY